MAILYSYSLSFLAIWTNLIMMKALPWQGRLHLSCDQNLSLTDEFRSCRTQGDAKRGLDQYNEREGLESTQRCHTLFLRTQWYAGVVIVKATIPALHLQMLMSPMEKTLTNVILNSRSWNISSKAELLTEEVRSLWWQESREYLHILISGYGILYKFHLNIIL